MLRHISHATFYAVFVLVEQAHSLYNKGKGVEIR